MAGTEPDQAGAPRRPVMFSQNLEVANLIRTAKGLPPLRAAEVLDRALASAGLSRRERRELIRSMRNA